jgi:hypothetical protein
VLVAVVAWVIWTMLLMLRVVQIEPLLRWFGAYRLEQPWAALLVFGPPAVTALAFGVFAARRATKRR